MEDKLIKVLLVEDNPGDARLIEQRLRWESIPGIADASSITHVETLKDGFGRLEEEAYDVVLLDLGLPESTGIETLERLLAHILSIPIVVLTGLDDTETAIEAIQKGAQDYLVKDEISSRLLKRAIRYSIERKRTEEKLRESMEKLRAMFESIGDAVILTDLTGTIVEANDAAAHLVGYSDKKELIGQNAFEFVHSGDRELAKETTRKAIEEGQAREKTEYRILTTDGREIDTDSSVGILYNDSGNPTGVINVVRDITERKKMEEELLKVQKLESIGVLAGGIAHDLNNVLTAIVGNISLAVMHKSPEDKDTKLAEAERACKQVSKLTKQLLVFSKGGGPVKELANIGEVLIDSATFALRGSSTKCEFSIPDDLWTAEVDEGQISQVINNLVINADQAMPGGGIICLKAENVVVGTEDSLPLRDGVYVKVSVEDQGVGIPEAVLQSIFDPFFTTKQKGSGLGLATAYSIIRKHDGCITVESQLEKGTTFYVYLPASPDQVLTEDQKAEVEPIMGQGRILVIDDEKYVRDTMAEMLSSLGYDVTTSLDGAEAIELYKEAGESGNPFDGVIADLTIPGGMGGKETIQKLIEIDPEVKAIVSSGYSNDPIMTDFKKHGFKDIIPKPYKTRELSEVLHRVIT